jgi:hypothetical protein
MLISRSSQYGIGLLSVWVLKKLLNSNTISDNKFSRGMKITAGMKTFPNIHSDYYQPEVLIKIAEKIPNSESLKKQLSEAAKKIKSDYMEN